MEKNVQSGKEPQCSNYQKHLRYKKDEKIWTLIATCGRHLWSVSANKTMLKST
jgi:hypothetical protein